MGAWRCDGQRMTLRQREYAGVLGFLVVGLVLSVVLIGAARLVATQLGDTQKLTAYECGFDPFDDARSPFDVRFYLVALLFLVFDLEAAYLFPWSVCLGELTGVGFWTRCDFLVELAVGFVYAWKIGALEWA